MTGNMRHVLAITSICVVSCLAMAVYAQETPRDDKDEAEVATATGLSQPKWEKGSTWMVETVTQPLQTREVKPSTKPVPIRWQFRVADLENLAGRECYRIEIECLARGRIRPKSMIWVDQKSGFLRQYKTELAVAGQMRPMVESYDHAKSLAAPVITPVNALPIALPAFVPPGSKANTFTYTSAPMQAGAKSKDLGLVTFAHEVTQTTSKAGSKALEIIPKKGRPKSLDAKPITEVVLGTPTGEVKQLWQEGQPWPLVIDNGRTKAYLVTSE